MIRPLRRAHPIVVSVVAVFSVAGAIAAGLRQVPTAKSPSPASLQAPDFPEAVYATMAYPVGGDTLYLELARSTGDTAGVFARFTASLGARWPDAVVLWTPDPAANSTRAATALGQVAAGHTLVARLSSAIGSIQLYSTAWDRLLGSWSLPSPTLAAGRGR